MRRKVEPKPARRTLVIGNYSKKLVQLNRVLYNLESERERLRFHREQLMQFFEPRIDNAINTSHNHNAKMQNTAKDDYEFITDRTARFYARKDTRLRQELPQLVATAENNHNEKELEIKEITSEVEELIRGLNQKIAEDEKRFDGYVSQTMQTMDQKVKKAREIHEKEINEYLEGCQKRDHQFKMGSDRRCGIMREEHELLMRNLQNEGCQGSGMASHLLVTKEKIGEMQKGIVAARAEVERMKQEHNNGIQGVSGEVVNVCGQIKCDRDMEDADKEKMRQEMETCESGQVSEREECLKQRETRKVGLEEELRLKRHYLDSLIEQMKKEREARRCNTNQGCVASEYELKALMQRLSKERTTLAAAHAEKQAVITSTVDRCVTNIVTEGEAHERNVRKMEDDMMAVRDRSQNALESARMRYLSEREALVDELERKLRDATDSLRGTKENTQEGLRRKREELGKLGQAKDDLIIRNGESLKRMDDECEGEIFATKQELDRDISDRHSKLLEDEKAVGPRLAQAIEYKRKLHEQHMIDLRERLERERITTLRNIEEAGYSEKERMDIESVYSREYSELQESMRGEVPFTANGNVFGNMDAAYNDLQKELKDRQCRIAGLKTMMNRDLKSQEATEIERHKRVTSRSSNRARDQAKQALTMQIRDVQKRCQEQAAELKNELEKLREMMPDLERSDDDDGLNETQTNLERELSEIESASVSQVSDVERGYRDERNALTNEIHAENRRIAECTDKITQSMKMQTNLFNKEFTELNGVFQTFRNESATVVKTIRFEHSIKASDRLEMHMRNTTSLNQQHQDAVRAHTQLRDSLSRRAVEMETSREDHRAYSQRCEAELANARAEMATRREIADETICNINDKIRTMRDAHECSVKSGRSVDSELIERLNMIAQAKHVQLVNAVKDLTLYRNMYIDQEKKINAKFTGMPDIGVLRTAGMNRLGAVA